MPTRGFGRRQPPDRLTLLRARLADAKLAMSAAAAMATSSTLLFIKKFLVVSGVLPTKFAADRLMGVLLRKCRPVLARSLYKIDHQMNEKALPGIMYPSAVG